MEDVIQKKVTELQHGLYGPRYCDNCRKVVPVLTYKLEGSDYTRSEGYKVTVGFVGSHVCSECRHTIIQQTSGKTE